MSFCINLFALHYFLWFSALTSIYGYISVYAEHYANASSSQYGMLNMVLPFATIGSKLFFCSLADRHRAYRSFFILFLISSLIGFGSFGVLPFFIVPQPKDAGLNHLTWVLICLMTSVATLSMSVISCLSDAFAMNSSKKHDTSYGFIRLWGTLGWGATSFILSFINQTDKLPLLVPGLFLTIGLLFLDILFAIFWPYRDDFKLNRSSSDFDQDSPSAITSIGDQSNQAKPSVYGATQQQAHVIEYSSQQPGEKSVNTVRQHYRDISSVSTQWMLFKEVAIRRRSIYRYMALFTISGALISLQWSYFFPFLKLIYSQDFEYISGLSMVAQSMLGELPFFILSDYIVNKLGRTHTLSISMISIGMRYLLYRYLLTSGSMYFVLVTESFQGPNFGLFYVVMTEVGLEYSTCEEAIVGAIDKGYIANNPDDVKKLRQSLRATMQSLMSACYEGLGLGLGSIIGGLVIDNYGFDNLWFYSAIIAIAFGLSNFFVELLALPILYDKESPVQSRRLALSSAENYLR